MERKSNTEFKKELEDRTRLFSSSVFKYLDALPKRTSTKVIASQLGRSASSIGANYREANRAESRQDFAHKIQIALKEAAESCYWMEILRDLYPSHDILTRLHEECMLLRNLLQSIGKSVRAKPTQTHSSPKPKTQTPLTH